MNRRHFIALSGAVAVYPFSANAAPILYTPGLVTQHLAAGETVFVDFYADWCSTCRAQHRVMDDLKAANPDYEARITFIQVDWDVYKDDALTVSLAIPRRSTLVVLKGDQELGRIVAGTGQTEIKALMDLALTAGS